jgi:hypothetical protein
MSFCRLSFWCHYAVCRRAECHSAHFNYAKWHYVEYHSGACHYAECHCAVCHSAKRCCANFSAFETESIRFVLMFLALMSKNSFLTQFSSGNDIHKNYVWASYELLTNFLWTSYEILNFLWTSYELLTKFDFLQNSYDVEFLTKFLWS